MGSQNLERKVNKVGKELVPWKKFLNNGIGILSFSFGLGCLGTSKPNLYALASFVFVIILVLMKGKLFPPTIKELKEKKNKTKSEKILLKRIGKRFFNVRVWITEYPLYFFGFTFLGCIAAGDIK